LWCDSKSRADGIFGISAFFFGVSEGADIGYGSII
jgi:hypothetical protein